MISVNEAQDIILKTSTIFQTHKVSLEDSHNQILGQNILAERDQPPFDRVTMDGIAINFEALKKNNFNIQEIQSAGSEQKTLKKSDDCLEAMTGACLPIYTDTVIPYEIISIKENTATVNEPELIKQGKNIHRMGSDYQQGDLLLKSGLKINSTIISTLASQGLAEVEVFKLPRVAIISTGNELIAPGTPIKDYQIRLSNSYALRSELKSFFPFSINRFHLIDDLSECNRKLTEIFNDHDILIISGGVSKGKFDFIPKALEDLKVEKHFHRISQRPGKPMWYGTKDEKQVFALPGNPMSGLVCMRRYVIPALQKRLGQENTRADHVKLDQNISLNGQLTQFKAARVINNNGYLSAKVIENNTSGDFFSLCHSNGIIEFEKGINDFNAGSVLAFYPWGK